MADSAANGLGGSHIVVLFHTLPAGPSGVRAEEAAYRQYNSCVDFTFEEDLACSNARKLKRLNVIFERAADRHSGGIREDKLLRLLPPGTATKFGLDPAAVKRRLQIRRELAAAEESERSRRKKKKQRDRNGASSSDVETNNPIDKANELRVLSRGTFLAMFANETSTFINTMGQNEKADRERRAMRSNKTGSSSRGSNSAGRKKEFHAAQRKDNVMGGSIRGKPQSFEGGSNQIAPPPAPRSSSPHSAPGDIISTKDRTSRGSTSKKRRSGRHSRSSQRSHRRRGRGKDDAAGKHVQSSRSQPRSSRSRLKSREHDFTQQHRRAASEGNMDDGKDQTPKSGGQHRRHSFDALPDVREIMGEAGAHMRVSDRDPEENPSDGHSADEAGGRSNALLGTVCSEREAPATRFSDGDSVSKSDFSHREQEQNQKMPATKPKGKAGAEEELSREERRKLRREKRRMKEEARRIKKREQFKAEEKRRILEEEHAKDQERDLTETEEKSDECVFFSSVVKVFNNLFPRKGVVAEVAPSGACLDSGNAPSHFQPRQSHHVPRARVPIADQNYPQVANPWHYPGVQYGQTSAFNVPHSHPQHVYPALGSFSYSNDSLDGERMLSKPQAMPQVLVPHGANIWNSGTRYERNK